MLPTSLMWVSWGENSQEAAPSCVGIGHHLQEHLVAHRNKGSWLERPTEATESLPIGMATVNIHIVVAAQVVVLQVNKAEWQDHHLSLRHLSGETPLDYWKIIYDYTGTILLLKQFKGNISNICYDYICSSSILMFTFRGHCTWNKASCKNCLQLAVAVVFLEGNWEFGVSEWVAQSCCNLTNSFSFSVIVSFWAIAVTSCWTHCDSPHTFGVWRVNSWVALAPDYSRLTCDVTTASKGWSRKRKMFYIFQIKLWLTLKLHTHQRQHVVDLIQI